MIFAQVEIIKLGVNGKYYKIPKTADIRFLIFLLFSELGQNLSLGTKHTHTHMIYSLKGALNTIKIS